MSHFDGGATSETPGFARVTVWVGEAMRDWNGDGRLYRFFQDNLEYSGDEIEVGLTL